MQVLKTRGIEYETIDISAPGMQVQHFDILNIYGTLCLMSYLYLYLYLYISTKLTKYNKN